MVFSHTAKVPSRHGRCWMLPALMMFCALMGGCDAERAKKRAEESHENQKKAFASILEWGGDVRCQRLQDPDPTSQRRKERGLPPGRLESVIAVYNSTTSPSNPTLDMTNKRLSVVAELKELRFLQLGNTKVTDAGMKHLQRLNLLEGLDLSHTGITDEGLACIQDLTLLRSLQLQHTAITDAGLNRLRGLYRLEELFLQDTKVTEAGIAKLKKSLPTVRIAHSHESETADDLAISTATSGGGAARYVLLFYDASSSDNGFAIERNVFAIDADPGLSIVDRWIARNRDALELVSFSKGHIAMAFGDQLIQLKDGKRLTYTLRNNMYFPYSRGIDDTIEEVLSYSERQAIEEIFRRHGTRLDEIP